MDELVRLPVSLSRRRSTAGSGTAGAGTASATADRVGRGYAEAGTWAGIDEIYFDRAAGAQQTFLYEEFQ